MKDSWLAIDNWLLRVCKSAAPGAVECVARLTAADRAFRAFKAGLTGKGAHQ